MSKENQVDKRLLDQAPPNPSHCCSITRNIGTEKKQAKKKTEKKEQFNPEICVHITELPQ